MRPLKSEFIKAGDKEYGICPCGSEMFSEAWIYNEWWYNRCEACSKLIKADSKADIGDERYETVWPSQ